MKPTLSNILIALLVTYVAIKVSTARSFLKDAQPQRDESNDLRVFQDQSQTTSAWNSHHEIIDVLTHRSKRTVDECPVHPDTPVILNGNEAFFDYNVNEAEPVPLPGENEDISCPAQHGSWWPGVTTNLAASCPWTWVTYDTWSLGVELYPRYVTQAKCLCSSCVNDGTMGCRKLKREFQFYKKVGCQGNKPVFEGGRFRITVGCYCSKE